MSIPTAHFLHGIVLPSAVYISQCESAGVQMGNSDLIGYSAGHPFPMFKSIHEQSMRQRFTTTQIATLLTVFGQFGADLSGGNVDLLFKKATDLGTRAAAASSLHERFRCAQAMGIWSEITAQQGREATISGEIVPTWNGSVNPIVYAGSQALSGTPAANQYFTLGPVVINGTALAGVQSVKISSGIQLMVKGSDGEIWPTFACVQVTRPMITVSGVDLPNTWAYATGGTALTSLSVTLRKKAATGGNVANGTGEHVSFTATAGVIEPVDSNGNLSSEADANLQLTILSADAATNPFTISTTATIS